MSKYLSFNDRIVVEAEEEARLAEEATRLADEEANEWKKHKEWNKAFYDKLPTFEEAWAARMEIDPFDCLTRKLSRGSKRYKKMFHKSKKLENKKRFLKLQIVKGAHVKNKPYYEACAIYEAAKKEYGKMLDSDLTVTRRKYREAGKKLPSDSEGNYERRYIAKAKLENTERSFVRFVMQYGPIWSNAFDDEEEEEEEEDFTEFQFHIVEGCVKKVKSQVFSINPVCTQGKNVKETNGCVKKKVKPQVSINPVHTPVCVRVMKKIEPIVMGVKFCFK